MASVHFIALILIGVLSIYSLADSTPSSVANASSEPKWDAKAHVFRQEDPEKDGIKKTMKPHSFNEAQQKSAQSLLHSAEKVTTTPKSTSVITKAPKTKSSTTNASTTNSPTKATTTVTTTNAPAITTTISKVEETNNKSPNERRKPSLRKRKQKKRLRGAAAKTRKVALKERNNNAPTTKSSATKAITNAPTANAPIITTRSELKQTLPKTPKERKKTFGNTLFNMWQKFTNFNSKLKENKEELQKQNQPTAPCIETHEYTDGFRAYWTLDDMRKRTLTNVGHMTNEKRTHLSFILDSREGKHRVNTRSAIEIILPRRVTAMGVMLPEETNIDSAWMQVKLHGESDWINIKMNEKIRHIYVTMEGDYMKFDHAYEIEAIRIYPLMTAGTPRFRMPSIAECVTQGWD